MNMMDEYLDVMNRAIPADTNPAIVETVRGVFNAQSEREARECLPSLK